MSYSIDFIGHCHEDNHDKVWGFVTASDALYNFWGRRGKKFTFQKQIGASWRTAETLQKKAREKCKAGRANGTYREIQLKDVDTIWPGFVHDLEMQLVFAKLANNFRFGAEEDA